MPEHSYAKRFARSAELAPQLFPVFWNEFLFRLNSCQRKGLNPAACGYFVVAPGAGEGRSWVRTIRYYVAALLQLLALLLRTQKKPAGEGPIFLFTNLRHGRFFKDNVAPVRVGLYNFRYLSYPHLLAALSTRELLWGIGRAFATYSAFRTDCQARCAGLGVDWLIYRRLSLFGRLRHLDALLHTMALEKRGGEVWSPGHFDMYAFVASHLRERGGLDRLVGLQHGLFEHAPSGHAFERFYADTYQLLFAESRRWVEAYFLKNPECEVILDAKEAHIDFEQLDRAENGRVIAYAAQEISDLDEQLIERLLQWKEHAATPLEVLLYAHPLYPCENTGWVERGLTLYDRKRHANIDVLITRFSTLGLDYHRIGVPVLFVPFGDRVCIFDDPAFAVCSNLDAMVSALEKHFGGRPDAK